MLKLQSRQRSRMIVAGAAALALTVGPLSTASADLVSGTGTPKSDCYVELDANAPTGAGPAEAMRCRQDCDQLALDGCISPADQSFCRDRCASRCLRRPSISSIALSR